MAHAVGTSTPWPRPNRLDDGWLEVAEACLAWLREKEL
jgi:hypothetical protein